MAQRETPRVKAGVDPSFALEEMAETAALFSSSTTASLSRKRECRRDSPPCAALFGVIDTSTLRSSSNRPGPSLPPSTASRRGAAPSSFRRFHSFLTAAAPWPHLSNDFEQTSSGVLPLFAASRTSSPPLSQPQSTLSTAASTILLSPRWAPPSNPSQ